MTICSHVGLCPALNLSPVTICSHDGRCPALNLSPWRTTSNLLESQCCASICSCVGPCPAFKNKYLRLRDAQHVSFAAARYVASLQLCLRIHLLNGRIIELRHDPAAKIADFKAHLQILTGTPVEQMKLIYNSVLLHDEQQIVAGRLHDASMCILMPLGGGGGLKRSLPEEDVLQDDMLTCIALGRPSQLQLQAPAANNAGNADLAHSFPFIHDLVSASLLSYIETQTST